MSDVTRLVLSRGCSVDGTFESARRRDGIMFAHVAAIVTHRCVLCLLAECIARSSYTV